MFKDLPFVGVCEKPFKFRDFVLMLELDSGTALKRGANSSVVKPSYNVTRYLKMEFVRVRVLWVTWSHLIRTG